MIKGGFNVRVKGLEPICTRHQILSLACLPISTHPQNLSRRESDDVNEILTGKRTYGSCPIPSPKGLQI